MWFEIIRYFFIFSGFVIAVFLVFIMLVLEVQFIVDLIKSRKRPKN